MAERVDPFYVWRIGAQVKHLAWEPFTFSTLCGLSLAQRVEVMATSRSGLPPCARCVAVAEEFEEPPEIPRESPIPL